MPPSQPHSVHTFPTQLQAVGARLLPLRRLFASSSLAISESICETRKVVGSLPFRLCGVAFPATVILLYSLLIRNAFDTHRLHLWPLIQAPFCSATCLPTLICSNTLSSVSVPLLNCSPPVIYLLSFFISQFCRLFCIQVTRVLASHASFSNLPTAAFSLYLNPFFVLYACSATIDGLFQFEIIAN